MADFDTLAHSVHSVHRLLTETVIDNEAIIAQGPQAENTTGQELFILATNFLLYVCLVLITYLVSKLYLESNHSWDFLEGTSFTVVPPSRENSIPADMNAEDEEEDGEQPKKDEADPSKGGGMKRSASGSSLGELLGEIEGWEPRKSATGAPTMGTKNQVLSQLAFCAVGLNACFLVWGVLQERMLTQTYGPDEEYFTYSYMLVFTNRLGGLVLSAVLMYLYKPAIETRAMLYEYSFPSVSNMLSSWCQYEALKYVSFPTQMLSKCFKLVPIMVMGKVLGNKDYPMYDYVVAALIGLGISLFLTSSEALNIGVDTFGEKESAAATVTGIVLLGFFLLFDSFTSQWQTRMFDRNKQLSPFQMMFAINAFSTMFSFVTLVHTNELNPAWKFVVEHPEIHFHFIAFSFCSTIGQLFIFSTIKKFGAVVFAIIMSTRILLSIGMSCYIYNHNITEMGYVGMIIVFGAIAYRIKRKTEDKRLISWEGIDDSEGPAMFNEWHEHLDL
mmetsp:Transcript_6774/g.10212  ORF Transcript_6774/g.10212 Transcript_6774/m.10212 type:complete len:501 (-) Transcript_6774:350-1852(-)